MKNVKTLTIAEFGIFTALAFIFSYIESLLPIPLPIPGIKLGFANLVLILALYRRGILFCYGVSLVRLVLTAFTFGNPFLLLFGLAGSLLSLTGMFLLKKYTGLHMITVSTAGGILHNVGQIAMACFILEGTAILSYLPILYFSGLVTGGLIGFLTFECSKRIQISSPK